MSRNASSREDAREVSSEKRNASIVLNQEPRRQIYNDESNNQDESETEFFDLSVIDNSNTNTNNNTNNINSNKNETNNESFNETSIESHNNTINGQLNYETNAKSNDQTETIQSDNETTIYSSSSSSSSILAPRLKEKTKYIQQTEKVDRFIVAYFLLFSLSGFMFVLYLII